MGTVVCGDGWGRGWLLRGRGGDGDGSETSCGVTVGDGDEGFGDGWGWVQQSVPMQLSNVYHIKMTLTKL